MSTVLLLSTATTTYYFVIAQNLIVGEIQGEYDLHCEAIVVFLLWGLRSVSVG